MEILSSDINFYYKINNKKLYIFVGLPRFQSILSMNLEQQKAMLAKSAELKIKYTPTIKFLKKRGLKFKYARVQEVQVEYFRREDFQKAVNDNKEQLQKLLNITTDPLVQIEEALYSLARPPNAKQLKFPPVLEFSKEKTQFASFKFVNEEKKGWLMWLVIISILFLVLFPIWPYELKYWIWLLSLYSLVAMIGILIVRLILYSFFSIFGVSLWLFPNILADASIIESFKPLYSFQKWQKSAINMILRLLMFAGFIYYGYEIYTDPSFVYKNLQSTQTAINDMHDWGVGKIKGQTNFSQRALTHSLEDILNQTKQDDAIKLQQEDLPANKTIIQQPISTQEEPQLPDEPAEQQRGSIFDQIQRDDDQTL